MWKSRALLTATALLPLALGGSALAADAPPGSVTLYNAAGVPVAILTPIASQRAASAAATTDPALQMIREMQAATAMDDPFGFPFARIMAQQDAMMRQVMEQMRQIQTAPSALGPNGTVNVVLPGGPGVAREIVVSSFSSGNGSCSQTITYHYPGGSAQPQVAVQNVGNACGAVGRPGTATIPAAAPSEPGSVAPEAVQPARDPVQKLYRIKYHVPATASAPGYRG